MKRTVIATALALLTFGGPTMAQTPVTVTPPTTSGPATPLPSKLGLMYHAHHVALRVADLEASVDWWKRVMGAVEVRRTDMSVVNEGAEIVFLHISGAFHIELVGSGNVETPPGLPPQDIIEDYGLTGWKHVGFYVADYGATKAHLAEQGVEIYHENTVPAYGVRLFLVKDPSGYFVEFYAPLDGN